MVDYVTAGLELMLAMAIGPSGKVDDMLGFSIQYPHRPLHGDDGECVRFQQPADQRAIDFIRTMVAAKQRLHKRRGVLRMPTLEQLGYADLKDIGTVRRHCRRVRRARLRP